jgi:hypothetical protein
MLIDRLKPIIDKLKPQKQEANVSWDSLISQAVFFFISAYNIPKCNIEHVCIQLNKLYQVQWRDLIE